MDYLFKNHSSIPSTYYPSIDSSLDPSFPPAFHLSIPSSIPPFTSHSFHHSLPLPFIRCSIHPSLSPSVHLCIALTPSLPSSLTPFSVTIPVMTSTSPKGPASESTGTMQYISLYSRFNNNFNLQPLFNVQSIIQ